MDYTIVLHCDNKAGVLTRVAAVLRRHGLQMQSQHAVADALGVRWSISAAGVQVATQEVADALDGTQGVQQIVSFFGGDALDIDDDSLPVLGDLSDDTPIEANTGEYELLMNAGAGDPGTEGNSVLRAVKRHKEFVADQDVINEILEKFPNIQVAVDTLRKRAPEDEVSKRLTDVGHHVGRIRARSHSGFSGEPTVANMLKHIVCPSFQAAATAEADDSGLRLLNSILQHQAASKKRASLFSAFSRKSFCPCAAFFSGYVEGMLNALPLQSSFQVEKALCRNEGEPYCLFECSTVDS